MAKFFIHRPIFSARVIAIIIMLGGALKDHDAVDCAVSEIAPTTVRISATYTGASAETVEKSVTTIIEDGMTGADDLTYMTSSSSTGSATVTLTFGNSIDPDIAQVQVQNKLQLVQSQLPDIVQSKPAYRSPAPHPAFFWWARLFPQTGSASRSNSAISSAPRSKTRSNGSKGVGSVQVFGTGYAMRPGSIRSSSTSSS